MDIDESAASGYKQEDNTLVSAGIAAAWQHLAASISICIQLRALESAGGCLNIFLLKGSDSGPDSLPYRELGLEAILKC